jgi:DNA-binding IclR family transcriptional regulator
MSYDLRRLRLHGLIERIPNSYRYQLTPQGLRIAMFFSRTYARLLRPALAEITDSSTISPSTLRSAFDRLQSAIDQRCEDLKLAA